MAFKAIFLTTCILTVVGVQRAFSDINVEKMPILSEKERHELIISMIRKIHPVSQSNSGENPIGSDKIPVQTEDPKPAIALNKPTPVVAESAGATAKVSVLSKPSKKQLTHNKNGKEARRKGVRPLFKQRPTIKELAIDSPKEDTVSKVRPHKKLTTKKNPPKNVKKRKIGKGGPPRSIKDRRTTIKEIATGSPKEDTVSDVRPPKKHTTKKNPPKNVKTRKVGKGGPPRRIKDRRIAKRGPPRNTKARKTRPSNSLRNRMIKRFKSYRLTRGDLQVIRRAKKLARQSSKLNPNRINNLQAAQALIKIMTDAKKNDTSSSVSTTAIREILRKTDGKRRFRNKLRVIPKINISKDLKRKREWEKKAREKWNRRVTKARRPEVSKTAIRKPAAPKKMSKGSVQGTSRSAVKGGSDKDKEKSHKRGRNAGRATGAPRRRSRLRLSNSLQRTPLPSKSKPKRRVKSDPVALKGYKKKSASPAKVDERVQRKEHRYRDAAKNPMKLTQQRDKNNEGVVKKPKTEGEISEKEHHELKELHHGTESKEPKNGKNNIKEKI